MGDHNNELLPGSAKWLSYRASGDRSHISPLPKDPRAVKSAATLVTMTETDARDASEASGYQARTLRVSFLLNALASPCPAVHPSGTAIENPSGSARKAREIIVH